MLSICQRTVDTCELTATGTGHICFNPRRRVATSAQLYRDSSAWAPLSLAYFAAIQPLKKAEDRNMYRGGVPHEQRRYPTAASGEPSHSRFLSVSNDQHRQPFSFEGRGVASRSMTGSVSHESELYVDNDKGFDQTQDAEGRFWQIRNRSSTLKETYLASSFSGPNDLVPHAAPQFSTFDQSTTRKFTGAAVPGTGAQAVQLYESPNADTDQHSATLFSTGSSREHQCTSSGEDGALAELTMLCALVASAIRICFEALYTNDDNIVVSAPTGSGKTTLFELAIIRMLLNHSDGKAIYMAPTKALCSERASDWQARFDSAACPVVELTGDSRLAGLEAARKARVIVTTPEKWDSLTRNWSVHDKLLGSLRLFLIDEIHSLHEKTRGACLEIVVARMSAFGTNLRIVAVSATIPNAIDIAEWIGQRSDRQSQDRGGELTSINDTVCLGRARLFQFGQEYRPVPLHRVVLGFKHSGDEWSFQSTLNQKILDVIGQHSKGKSTLVFVTTRKATIQTAEKLKEGYLKIQEGSQAPWPKPLHVNTYSDARLGDLAKIGIAYHHAGVSMTDRKLIEAAFIKGNISVLCCTSTLAVGVNLPAYCVVIRGTKRYDGSWVELSELELIQMMGRAGRPQFDKEGVAIILTEESKVETYKTLSSGETTIESSLHQELVEHINSEIGLRTNCSFADLERWLQKTFLYIRMQKNPSHYCREGDTLAQVGASPLEVLRKICREALTDLTDHHLVVSDARGLLDSTQFGDILSRYYISFETMLQILQLQEASVKNVLAFVSRAREFSHIRIRQGEKAAYVSLKSNSEIRFPPEKVAGVPEKVSLIIQGILSALPLQQMLKTDAATINPIGDILIIFRHCPQIIKATLDSSLFKKDVTTIISAMKLLRSINGRAWDDSSATLRQIEGIGDKSIKILAAAGILSYQDLKTCEPYRIEHLLNRKSPFGHSIISLAAALPQLQLSVKETAGTSRKRRREESNADRGVFIVVEITVALVKGQHPMPRIKTKDGVPFFCTILTHTSDNKLLLDYRRTPLRTLTEPKTFQIECGLTGADQKIVVLAACDEVAGSAVRKQIKPDVDPSRFPTAKGMSRGISAEIEGLEECSDLFDEEDWHPVEQREILPAAVAEDVTLPSAAGLKNQAGNVKQGSKQPESALPDAVPVDLQRLPNGNYRCRHRCKTLCRHLCCREGLPNAPAAKAGGSKTSGRLSEDSQVVLNRLEQLAKRASAGDGTSCQTAAPARQKGLILPRKTFREGSAEESPRRKKGQKNIAIAASAPISSATALTSFDPTAGGKRQPKYMPASVWNDMPILPSQISHGDDDILDEPLSRSPSPPPLRPFIASLGQQSLGDSGSGGFAMRALTSRENLWAERIPDGGNYDFRTLSESAASPADVSGAISQDELDFEIDCGFPIIMDSELEEVTRRDFRDVARDVRPEHDGLLSASPSAGSVDQQHRQPDLFFRTSPIESTPLPRSPSSVENEATFPAAQEAKDVRANSPAVKDGVSNKVARCSSEDDEEFQAWLMAPERVER